MSLSAFLPVRLQLVGWMLYLALIGGKKLAAESSSLEWREKEIRLAADSADDEVTATYHFTNSGPKAVSILKLATGCDCALARSSVGTIAPGQSGEISVVFTTRTRIGEQGRIISVDTDDSPGSPTQLHLSVNIQPLLTLTPKLILWKRDEARTTRRLKVEQAPGVSLEILSLEGDDATWRTTLLPADKTGVRHIEITPPASGESNQVVITLRYRARNKDLMLHAYAAIR